MAGSTFYSSVHSNFCGIYFFVCLTSKMLAFAIVVLGMVHQLGGASVCGAYNNFNVFIK